MSTSVTLLQLNIEKDKHLDRIVPFLKQNLPDVTCVQELCEADVVTIAETLGAASFFVPTVRFARNGGSLREGLGIFSRLPIKKSESRYYAGNAKLDQDYDEKSPATKRKTQSYAVAYCDVSKEGTTFRIATTHFTWTPDGQPDDFQREDIQQLFGALSNMGEFVLCGDFNAPRGGEIFTLLSNKLADNVPLRYKTSLDPELHRAGHLDRMVDGIFSTSKYRMSDVKMICGLSDHCALQARIY